jgi:hypothetical protein
LKRRILHRAKNKLRTYPKEKGGTSDGDIERITFLGVDIDPERPAGIAATEGEVKDAERVATETLSHLNSLGFPEPYIHMFSGNGSYLIWKVDLPADNEPAALLDGFYEALSFRFSNRRAKIDTSVKNFSRIWRVAGTVNRKGDDTEERPHRTARVLSHGPDATVSPKTMQKVIDDYTKPKPRRNSFEGGIKLAQWIKDHDIEDAQRVPGNRSGTADTSGCLRSAPGTGTPTGRRTACSSLRAL